MTLTEFLLARIAEDEATASAATPGPWHSPPTREYPAGPPITAGFRADADHVARWDPARVLAECEAKRRIIGLGPVACPDGIDGHYPHPIEGTYGCDGCDEAWAADAPWRAMLWQLAAVYADHPDYREEWRP